MAKGHDRIMTTHKITFELCLSAAKIIFYSLLWLALTHGIDLTYMALSVSNNKYNRLIETVHNCI